MGQSQSAMENGNKQAKWPQAARRARRKLPPSGVATVGLEPTFWTADCSLRRDVQLAAASRRAQARDECAADADAAGGADDKTQATELEFGRLVRKLSNVSNRNVQLLALHNGPRGISGQHDDDDCDAHTAAPRPKETTTTTTTSTRANAPDLSERGGHVEGTRAAHPRRQSSLINMILGSSRAGPRFSDDLCSLDSRISELCSFGIELPASELPIIRSSQQQLKLPAHASCYNSGAQDALGKRHTNRRRSTTTTTTRRRLSAIGAPEQEWPAARLGSIAKSDQHSELATENQSRAKTRAIEAPVSAPDRRTADEQSQSAPSGPLAERPSSLGLGGHACLPINGEPQGAGKAPTLAASTNLAQDSSSGQRLAFAGQSDASAELIAGSASTYATGDEPELEAGRPDQDSADADSRGPRTRNAGAHNQSPARSAGSQQRQHSVNRHKKREELWPCERRRCRWPGRLDSSDELMASVDLSGPFDYYRCSIEAAAASVTAAASHSADEAAEPETRCAATTCAKSGRRCSACGPLPAGRLVHKSDAAAFRRSSSELSLYACFGFKCAGCSSNRSSLADGHHVLSNVASIGGDDDDESDDDEHCCGCCGEAPSTSSTVSQNQLIRHADVDDSAAAAVAPPLALTTRSPACHRRAWARSERTGATNAPRNPTSSASETDQKQQALLRQTKLIILFQVCLPFILAGFGNMAAGLAFSGMAQWRAFLQVPSFFVLLPSFVGLKGNIEMTLASRLSTLSNLNLLLTADQRRQAYVSNLALMLCHAIGLSTFATFASVACDTLIGGADLNKHLLSHAHQHVSTSNRTAPPTSDHLSNSSMALPLLDSALLVVLPCALLTSVLLVIVSSVVVWWTVHLANRIRVNPDNLSTLVAALYGDVTCVLTYGLFANWMHTIYIDGARLWPVLINCIAALVFVLVTALALKFQETQRLVISSIPPTLTSIVVSLGSGAILSLVLGRFHRIALYQPVVNGFGANLIAAQASRISTWLWCRSLRKMSTVVGPRNRSKQIGTRTDQISRHSKTNKQLGQVQFEPSSPIVTNESKSFASKTDLMLDAFKKALGMLKKIAHFALTILQWLLWSFCNSTPNSTAAKLLLITIIPAHSLYFIVIWLLSPANHVILTWQFYLVYIALCLVQVFSLLLMCEPLMRFLIRYNMDPDVFGIALLMSLADLIGTLCLAGGFQFLASIGDANTRLEL